MHVSTLIHYLKFLLRFFVFVNAQLVMTQKVFCIGSHKTGTSSVAIALKLLNYKVCRRLGMLQERLSNINLIESLKKEQINDILKVTEEFDAFCDNPWPLLYQSIDDKYPNCKFILTIRDESSWLKSVLNYFGESTSPIRELMYGKDLGSPIGNEDLYLKKYNQHNQEVKTYFKDRPNDLLIFDIDEKNKWEKLCTFLGKEIPELPFPYENKSQTLAEDSSPKKQFSISRFFRYLKSPISEQLLILETFVSISIARLLIIIFPFQKLAKRLGQHKAESPQELVLIQQSKSLEIGKMIRKVSAYTPFRSLCFEQALACKMMLNRRKISSTIYFGLAKEKSTQLKAHAWLRSGQHILTGNKGKENFKIVSYFGS